MISKPYLSVNNQEILSPTCICADTDIFSINDKRITFCSTSLNYIA